MFTGALDGLPLLGPVVRGVSVGLMIGAVVGLGEEFFVPITSRRLRFAQLNILRFGVYVLAIQGALIVVNVLSPFLTEGQSIAAATLDYTGGPYLWRDAALAVLATLVLIPALQLRRLHHPSELWKLVTGRYHYPKEEDLVFLWADLAESTPIAEKLGHVGYSHLLRDLYADLSEPILAWRGRVYQHLGDGVIVTWTTRSLPDAAAVRCFFDMVRHLESHAEHYRAEYGLVPKIRGAVHTGPVVLTWVGEAKKELAYHGDTLNAAARMQAACKPLGVSLLVSERVARGVERLAGMTARSVGEVELRGKEAPLPLFTVEAGTGHVA